MSSDGGFPSYEEWAKIFKGTGGDIGVTGGSIKTGSAPRLTSNPTIVPNPDPSGFVADPRTSLSLNLKAGGTLSFIEEGVNLTEKINALEKAMVLMVNANRVILNRLLDLEKEK